MANNTIIVANNTQKANPNSSDFETYFGFAPNKAYSDLDGNGDDAYELIDPLNKVKDVFGVPNIDGTNTVWDYEDGVAIRKVTITQPNNVFLIDEWQIKTKVSQLTTTSTNVDFTPGVR